MEFDSRYRIYSDHNYKKNKVKTIFFRELFKNISYNFINTQYARKVETKKHKTVLFLNQFKKYHKQPKMGRLNVRNDNDCILIFNSGL